MILYAIASPVNGSIAVSMYSPGGKLMFKVAVPFSSVLFSSIGLI